jgi:hypothetical protein
MAMPTRSAEADWKVLEMAWATSWLWRPWIDTELILVRVVLTLNLAVVGALFVPEQQTNGWKESSQKKVAK